MPTERPKRTRPFGGHAAFPGCVEGRVDSGRRLRRALCAEARVMGCPRWVEDPRGGAACRSDDGAGRSAWCIGPGTAGTATATGTTSLHGPCQIRISYLILLSQACAEQLGSTAASVPQRLVSIVDCGPMAPGVAALFRLVDPVEAELPPPAGSERTVTAKTCTRLRRPVKLMTIPRCGGGGDRAALRAIGICLYSMRSGRHGCNQQA